MNERDLGRLLIEDLAQVVGALGGGTASVGTGAAPEGPQWTITVASEGAVRAACVLAIDHAGAAALATAVVEKDDDAAIEGVLRDVVAQAISVVVARSQAVNVQLTVMAVAKADAAPSGSALSTAIITAGLAVPIQLGYYAVLAPTVTGAKSRQGQKTMTADQQQARLDAILDIDLPVVVRFGRTEMPLRAVTRIAPGSVIDLGRSPDDPVELLVSDRVVARGEVVVVGGNYGIRIVDVVSPSERMRSMEA
ncbi:MAG: FliM/FliN family flagellar motor switch protein [Vicinamibacterales bacterium]